MSRSELPLGTAVITGAAHGIGAAFARELATGPRRLVLVDKDEAALESMSDALIGSAEAAGVEILPADLTRTEDQDRVVERIEQEEDLRLLISNAGFGDPIRFHKQDPQTQRDMLQVHVVSTVRLCRAALPGLERSGQGHIINVSSMAAGLRVPNNVMYGSTKDFIRNFSQILRVECRSAGVNLQLLCPGYTRTEFHRTGVYKDRDFGGIPDWMWSSAEKVARSSLRALKKRKFLCVPGFRNRCLYAFLQSPLVPGWMIRMLLA